MNHLKDGDAGSRLHNGVDVRAKAANVSALMQHLVEEKHAKRESDLTLDEMYNSRYDFEDDEDDDSDWEPSVLPSPNVVEIPKWFCLNCTMVNIGADSRCDVGVR
ncbi:hypothetical protein OROGR_031101 [Orobanche gracilis]